MAVIEVSAPNPLAVDCQACSGKGVFQGMFHRGICNACDGLGLVCRASGERLDPLIAALELRRRLNEAQRWIELPRAVAAGGPGADYQGQVNAHHRGGGNWTGD